MNPLPDLNAAYGRIQAAARRVRRGEEQARWWPDADRLDVADGAERAAAAALDAAAEDASRAEAAVRKADRLAQALDELASPLPGRSPTLPASARAWPRDCSERSATLGRLLRAPKRRKRSELGDMGRR